MNEPLPWKILAERNTKDFKVFRTRTLDVEDPRTGAAHVRTVIDSPDWVNVVALTAGDELILVRQFRFGVWASTLELPGGLVDGDESPASAAVRELEEETGYRPASLHVLGACHPNPAVFNNRLHVYLASGCEHIHDGNPDEGEDIRVELVPRHLVKRLVREGAITHAMTLAALLMEVWRE